MRKWCSNHLFEFGALFDVRFKSRQSLHTSVHYTHSNQNIQLNRKLQANYCTSHTFSLLIRWKNGQWSWTTTGIACGWCGRWAISTFVEVLVFIICCCCSVLFFSCRAFCSGRMLIGEYGPRRPCEQQQGQRLWAHYKQQRSSDRGISSTCPNVITWGEEEPAFFLANEQPCPARPS